MRLPLVVGSFALLLGACAAPPSADTAGPAAVVERLDVRSRQAAFGGATFGSVGGYEVVVALASVRLDPRHPANVAIADLALAAEADGFVRYQTDVVLLRPQQAANASRVLIFDVANRGNKLALGRLNDGGTQFDTAAGAGNGWAMRQGHALLWVGWQGDVPLDDKGRTVGTHFPVATQRGQPITGTSREEFVFDKAEPASRATLTYPAATLDAAQATLTVRAHAAAAPVTLPAAAWRYLDASEIEIQRPAGFDAGAIYHFSYTAREPQLMGLGLSAVRDVVGFMQRNDRDAAGQPQPLADLRPRASIVMGISQSGRFLRDFIWYGFNAAPGGGRVFDGAMPLISGSRKSYTNARWAQPGRYSRQHEDHLFPGDQFPFSYAVSTDPLSGQRDGIFMRCEASRTCPKLMHLDSNLEFWQARASLLVTDGAGRDLALPEDVRAYLMASTQHGPAAQPAAGICQQPNNPAPQAATVRALMARLIAWAADGTPPPASRYPTLAASQLVPPQRAAIGFPDLAPLGVRFPAVINELDLVSYDGVEPRVAAGKRYQALVPRTDADGNDASGVRGTDIEVPLATYSGWGLRRAGFAEGQLCGLNGIHVPFSRDAADRQARSDPRPSIAERYPQRETYLQRVQQAARQLAADGLLLDEDVSRAVDRARSETRLGAPR